MVGNKQLNYSQECLGRYATIFNRILSLDELGTIQPGRKTTDTCENFQSLERTARFLVCLDCVPGLIPSPNAGSALVYFSVDIKSMWKSLIYAEARNLTSAPNITFTCNICDWDDHNGIAEFGWVQLFLNNR